MEVGQNKKNNIGHVRPWTLVVLLVMMILGGVGFIYRCDSSNQDLRAWEERKNMELARGHSSQMVAVPPIDVEAPSNTKTATFALG